MASPLSIPPEHRSVLEKISAISEENVTSILEALKSEPPSLSYRLLADRVATKVTDITPSNIRQIISTILSLYSLKSDAGVTTEILVEDIIAGLNNDRKKPLSTIESQRLTSSLSRLLDLEMPLGITSKARALMVENQKTFVDARILTDMRPVFGEDAAAGVQAVVIIHTMKIGFYENNNYKEFYISLDDSDIESLLEVVDRADEKQRGIRALLNKTDVALLNYTEPDEED